MHISFLTRGHFDYTNKFINELSTRYVDFQKYNAEKKVMEDMILQLRVCPIQLWDVSFPTQHYDAVYNTVLGGSKHGAPEMSHHQKYIWALRKAMKMKKIKPSENKAIKLAMTPPEHIEVIGVGMKEDYFVTEDGRHVKAKDKTPLSYEGI